MNLLFFFIALFIIKLKKVYFRLDFCSVLGANANKVRVVGTFSRAVVSFRNVSCGQHCSLWLSMGSLSPGSAIEVTQHRTSLQVHSCGLDCTITSTSNSCFRNLLLSRSK